ncbi:MAG TPA: serine hydrolase domain-containing protein [Pyrinomonadaceae bacterium]|nr:serine hydrolase domain-containing protein [Pyrinomonadaceae bacterium]
MRRTPLCIPPSPPLAPRALRVRPCPPPPPLPLLLLLLILLPAPLIRAQPNAPLPAEKIKLIEAAVAAEMSRQNIAGLSLAVVTDNQLRWSNGYGFADLENYVPAKAATVYRLASISKSVTAVAVMQLAERGQLDLDAPVQKYCPAFPEKQWPLTSRQILAHLSGIRHYKSEEEYAGTRRYESIAAGLEMFKNEPLLHEPGAKYTYTTFGYSVLGCALEGASGQKFSDFVRANVFQPAGMDRMRVDDINALIFNRAQGYRRTKTGELRNSDLADNSYKLPGGGLVSTVEDLAKFAIAVHTDKLLKKETTERMLTSQKTRDGKETNYGLGWSVQVQDGQKIVGHSGAQQRVSTYLHMIPARNFAVALMVNVEDTRLRSLAERIAEIVLK